MPDAPQPSPGPGDLRDVGAKFRTHGVQRRQRDVGQRNGLSSSVRDRLKELERENSALKWANEI